MKRALFALAFACAPVFAETLYFEQAGDVLRLHERPCTNPLILNRIHPQMREDFSEADATVSGQQYSACWRVMGTAAHLVYEDGDQGLVPLADAKPGT